MADPLYELLIPYFDAHDTALRPAPNDAVAAAYLARLSTLPLAALTSSEPHLLSQSSSSILRSLQSLSKRSHKPIISASDHLSHLRDILPKLGHDASTIHSELPKLETAAQQFTQKYQRSSTGGDNAILDRRRKAMLLSRNIDRVTDILDLPTLLSSAISSSTSASSQATTPGATSTTTATANYASALDLHAHIKRLHTLYPHSPLISSLSAQAEQELKTMTTNLITSLQSQSIKLAGAMRTIGWLRRVAPELDSSYSLPTSSTVTWSSKSSVISGEGTLGALFLVSRLSALETMLSALDPLRELADQETERRVKGTAAKGEAWSTGQQTERFLKRYIEIFREQSFAIISMYKSIFPSALPAPGSDVEAPAPAVKPVNTESVNPLQPIPSALATFPLHLVEMLFDTLRTYLPNIHDRSARDSLLTQVLYCAGSLGRLGGDFSMMIALLEEDLKTGLGEDDSDESEDEENDGCELDDEEVDEEWVEVMKKHRVQASRLELLASGVGTGRTSSPVDRTGSPSH
ncbi:Dor1-domain-containing protein [Amniculicola lignicola CBS 123094]|uniref:Conserved oligomeric Golgi complex subunit 8 n=1 Tax=Amniculicola lignicola CBS 123094 TaxID=1392246 RepID=A0A6A5WWB1_9PLEO|nr:Dor1-domain-containing protein [Amniculicola lignicola CBS 123094]